MEITADNQRHAIVSLDVGKFLALSGNDEIDQDVLACEAHHRRLGPAVRPDCSHGHQAVIAEHLDGFFLHRPFSTFSQSWPMSFSCVSSETRYAVDQPS